MSRRVTDESSPFRRLQQLQHSAKPDLEHITSWIAQVRRCNQPDKGSGIRRGEDLDFDDRQCGVLHTAVSEDDVRTLRPGPNTVGYTSSIGEHSCAHDAAISTDISVTARPSFQKRKRHKTRADRYDIDKGKRNKSSRRLKRPPRHRRSRARKSARGADVMDSFKSGALDRSQIIVKPRLTAGMFLNGKASKARQVKDLSFNAMPFLEGSSEAEGHNSPASLSAKHLISDEQLFGCHDEIEDQTQSPDEESPHPSRIAPQRQGPTTNTQQQEGSISEPRQDEPPLFVEATSGESPTVQDNPEREGSTSQRLHPATERLSPNTRAAGHRPRISEDSGGFQELLLSGVFEFGEQTCKDTGRPTNRSGVKRAIDTPGPYTPPQLPSVHEENIVSEGTGSWWATTQHNCASEGICGRAWFPEEHQPLVTEGDIDILLPHSNSYHAPGFGLYHIPSTDVTSLATASLRGPREVWRGSRTKPASTDLPHNPTQQTERTQSSLEWSQWDPARRGNPSTGAWNSPRTNHVITGSAANESLGTVTESSRWDHAAHDVRISNKARDKLFSGNLIGYLDRAAAYEAAAEKLKDSWAANGQYQEWPVDHAHGYDSLDEFDTEMVSPEIFLSQDHSLDTRAELFQRAEGHWHQHQYSERYQHDLGRKFWQPRRHI